MSYPYPSNDDHLHHQYDTRVDDPSFSYPPQPHHQQHHHQQQQPQHGQEEGQGRDRVFNEASFIGRDEAIPGGRTTKLHKINSRTTNEAGAEYEYEKGLNPVTRGSIAAQMAAEGQIPKKEGLRMWRTDEHKGAFTRGGKGRMCARICCCAFMLVIIILAGIVSSFLLWTKPPEVSFNGVNLPTNGTGVQVQSDGFLIDFTLDVGVINPNFFGVNFKKIEAKAFYYLKPTTSFGGGSLTAVEIKKNSKTDIRFPFEVNYTTSYDSDLIVLKDIATRCGFINTTSSIANTDLVVNYNLQLTFKVIAIEISPSFSSSVQIACPLSQSDVSSLLGGLGNLARSRTRTRRRSLISDQGDISTEEEVVEEEEKEERVFLDSEQVEAERQESVEEDQEAFKREYQIVMGKIALKAFERIKEEGRFRSSESSWSEFGRSKKSFVGGGRE